LAVRSRMNSELDNSRTSTEVQASPSFSTWTPPTGVLGGIVAEAYERVERRCARAGGGRCAWCAVVSRGTAAPNGSGHRGSETPLAIQGSDQSIAVGRRAGVGVRRGRRGGNLGPNGTAALCRLARRPPLGALGSRRRRAAPQERLSRG